MLSILGWLFIGVFAGSIGQALAPRNNHGEKYDGIDSTMLMGICGALIGGVLGGSPFRPGQGGARFITSLALATLGSLVLLVVHHLSLNIVTWLSTPASFVKSAILQSKLADAEEVRSLSAEEI